MKNGMRKIAKEEVGKHVASMHKGVKNMRAGGKTNSEMKKYGRGMAKVMNQRSPMRGSSGPR
jgi:hypothetical protein